jgi:hypothetical protein
VIINLWLLPIALLLLWLPRQWFRFGGKVAVFAGSGGNGQSTRRRRRSPTEERDKSDVSLKLKDEVSKVRNWIDLVRALIGGIALTQVCFSVAPDAAKGTSTQLFVIEALILVVAVLIQTIRLENRFSLVAPVFFLLGLSFALIGWKAALFAVVGIWTLNLVLPGAGVFLFFFAALEICFGLLLGASLTSVELAASLSILPFFFSAVTKRPLVRLNKKTKSRR